MLGRTRHVHFVGIGGIGMSGIAELLANLGYAVSGSDARASAVTARLETLGVRVSIGHAAGHVGEADVVVVSSAVRADNPEVVEARRRHVPVIPRAEMLAELMRLRHGIAVAGAHGKTTTTSMIALVLERAGLDPTAVIGGRLSAFGSNARLGSGELMVAEADESDGSFLKLSPAVAIITNIDREHLDHYGDFSRVCDAFLDFANKVPFHGAVIACLDDPELARLVASMTRRVVTYGIDRADADVHGAGVVLEAFGSRCEVSRRAAGGGRETLGSLRLVVPGRHNLLNALAAVATALEFEVPFPRIAGALAEFHGAERRFQVLGDSGGVRVVDDYGHHPTEIAAVIAAARGDAGRRLVVAFQPHRYTRTAALVEEFGTALAGADEVVLTDIYAAGEEPLPGVTVETIADAVRRRRPALPVHVVRPLDEMVPLLVRLARPGDLVVTLGAGSIGTIGERVLQALRNREGGRTEASGPAGTPSDPRVGGAEPGAPGQTTIHSPADAAREETRR
jgi:UDP-N-acetylmuramate--alanine ligase